ncbi:hypothetical protein Mgra_00010170 [Meloidogyne graminicola]|uniref:Uncharacterized protein n=1 Tax=Meloidogyne graminicola TaxID=189291 RepID=A0A8S9Z8A1_9BILA|nr:hypothetical protein Mgra_00010170 [Meloidogyne graminicola]
MISLGADKLTRNSVVQGRTLLIHSTDISLTQQLFASSFGALLTSLLVTPMDVVKIRLQSQVRPLVKGECFLYSNGVYINMHKIFESPQFNVKI